MNAIAHTLTGLSAALVGAASLHAWTRDPLLAFAFGAGVVLAARAPDWMEVSRWETRGFLFWARKVRRSLIPHRTWTHWWPIWMGLFGLGLNLWDQSPVGAAALCGFGLGGALHVGSDWITPEGVPGFMPNQKHSLRLMRGGGFFVSLLLLGLSTFASALIFFSI